MKPHLNCKSVEHQSWNLAFFYSIRIAMKTCDKEVSEKMLKRGEAYGIYKDYLYLINKTWGLKWIEIIIKQMETRQELKPEKIKLAKIMKCLLEDQLIKPQIDGKEYWRLKEGQVVLLEDLTYERLYHISGYIRRTKAEKTLMYAIDGKTKEMDYMCKRTDERLEHVNYLMKLKMEEIEACR